MADGEDGEEDCRARAASRQLISGEESEATASGLAATFDLCGEGRSGARARRRRRRRLRCRGRGRGDSAGAFYRKVLDVFCNFKLVQYGISAGYFAEKPSHFPLIANRSFAPRYRGLRVRFRFLGGFFL